jgi:RNA polymerase sigma factor (sigma-70 family)
MNQTSRAEDNEWLREQMMRYERSLVCFAVHITGRIEVARDVVQDTFIRLCQAERAEIEAQVVSWLFRVCRNRALDVMKKERRMSYPGTERIEAEDSRASGPATIVETKQELGRALQALGTLPPNQQEVVRLKLQANLSYAEISQVTGHSVNHVGVLLHNALKTLRERLAEGGVS